MSLHSLSSAKADHRKLKVIAAAVILSALLAITSLAVSGPSWLRPHPPAPASISIQQEPSPVEVTRVTIEPTGFEPLNLTRPAGRFILAVENRTGLELINLRLTREGDSSTGPVREVQLPLGQLNWNEEMDLQPGTYLLTEVDHADWLCRITIQSP